MLTSRYVAVPLLAAASVMVSLALAPDKPTPVRVAKDVIPAKAAKM